MSIMLAGVAPTGRASPRRVRRDDIFGLTRPASPKCGARVRARPPYLQMNARCTNGLRADSSAPQGGGPNREPACSATHAEPQALARARILASHSPIAFAKSRAAAVSRALLRARASANSVRAQCTVSAKTFPESCSTRARNERSFSGESKLRFGTKNALLAAT